MDQNDQTTKSDNNQAEVKPSRYLCLEDGQDSLIEGPCPICGKPMVPDTEEIPGEKAVDDDDAHDGLPETANSDEDNSSDNQTIQATPEEEESEPEKYTTEDLNAAEKAKDIDLVSAEE